MGETEGFEREKLVMGVLISRPEFLGDLRERLRSAWGEIDLASEPVPFDFTNYYDREMGTPIFRCFFSFAELVSPEDLGEIKRRTNDLEALYVRDGGRRVNLDPGVLSLSKFILATTKNNAHRIPLNGGIYGELTLQFREGDFHPLEWTYPDFAGRANRDLLVRVREMYKRQRREGL